MHGLWGYMEMITANLKLRQVKIILIWEASSLELVPQSSGSWEEIARVVLTFRQGNMKEYVRSMASLNHDWWNQGM